MVEAAAVEAVRPNPEAGPATTRRILAFAYACEPGKGSEPGAGWLWARMLARLGEVWVVTRANNRETIEAELPSVPERDHLRFVYVDLPAWARFWKRGQRGIRLYYLLWQLGALATTRRLRRQTSFDVVWHVTLANAWLGSFAALAGPTFVYGPVGGGIGPPPPRLLPALGIRGILYELARVVARAWGRYLNPLARLSWRRAAVILALNEETRNWLPHRHRTKAEVFPNVVLKEIRGPRRGSTGPPTALFAGRLRPWKGAVFAIRALQDASDWQLIICGSGPDEGRLRRLALRLGVSERVTFLGWRRREEVCALMSGSADVFLLPSLHDDSPFVVAEALAAGLPVVCLARGGAPSIAGPAGVNVKSAGSPEEVAAALARALPTLRRRPPTTVQKRAREFLLAVRTERVAALLAEASILNSATPGNRPKSPE